MTVAVQTIFTASTANGVTTVFPYSFKITDEADLAVTVDGVLQTSGYTVSGVGDDAGGNVTFATAPANLAKVVRYLAPILKRDTDYQQFGDWLANVVNMDFDRLWLALQAKSQDTSRSVKLPIDTADDQTIEESAADRVGKFLSFDSNGNVTLSVLADLTTLSSVTAYMATLLDDADAATARATLGAASLGANTFTANQTFGAGAKLVFEGTTDDAFETTVDPGEPTADRTVALQDRSGTVALTSDTQQIFAGLTATPSGNTLVIGCGEISVDFRSATLSNGDITRVVGTPANFVISSGSTLGSTSGQKSRLAVAVMNNNGVLEFAVANVAGGLDMSESGVISTTAEGGAGGADSATVWYSTTARTNLPYRLLHYVESTQATAGTWVTAPSLIQGAGGQNTAAASFGHGQTWQSVTRAAGTTYRNDTGKLIKVMVSLTTSGSATYIAHQVTVNGYAFPQSTISVATNTYTDQFYFEVPPGQTYSFTASTGSGAISINASELR